MCGVLLTTACFDITAENQATFTIDARAMRWYYDASPSMRHVRNLASEHMASPATEPQRSGDPDVLPVRFFQNATCCRSAHCTQDQPMASL